MSRQIDLYLDDIKLSIKKIKSYTKGKTFDEFKNDELLCDAIIRNLEIIGEAVKQIPESERNKHKEIEWKKIAGLRDILIHEYFGIDSYIL